MPFLSLRSIAVPTSKRFSLQAVRSSEVHVIKVHSSEVHSLPAFLSNNTQTSCCRYL